MTINTFNPQILQHSATVAQFLNGEQEAAEILRSRSVATTTSLKSRSWAAGNELYDFFSSCVLEVASYFLHAICLKQLSKKIWVMSCHAMADATAIKAQKVFRENLLSRSINAHRKDTSDYYLHSSLRIPFATHPDSTRLNFFHQNGICRGMCAWFIFLYFKTQGHFTHPEQHVRAVGQQFEQGAARQPALLHSLTLPPLYELLKLNVHQDNSQISTTGKTQEQILRGIQCRIPGVYNIYTSTHQLVYIKIDDNEQYLFDPNTGCIKLSSIQLFKKAMESYFESHDYTRDILIDRYSSR